MIFIYDCREKHKSVLFILKECLMGWKNFITMKMTYKYYHKALHQELQSHITRRPLRSYSLASALLV